MEERTFEADGLTFTVRTKSEYQAYLDRNGWRYDIIEAVKRIIGSPDAEIPHHLVNIAFDFANFMPVTTVTGKTPLANADIVADSSDKAIKAAWTAYLDVIKTPGVIGSWVDAYNELNKVATTEDEKKDEATSDSE